MTTLSAVTAALAAALAVVMGSYDFTGVDAVKVGTFRDSPGTTPFCAIEPPEIVSRPWDKRQRKWVHTVTYTIRLWVPFTAETLPNRLAASTDVADRAAEALQAGRAGQASLKLVNSFVVRQTELDPAVSELAPDWVQAALSLEIVFVTAGGI